MKKVCGVGINDADYKITKNEIVGGKHRQVWMCPYYRVWKGLLGRCYYEKNLNRNPTYVGCTVCEEWLTFSNFRNWMVEQDWQGKQLDKDVLFQGNKIYSPESCVFVDRSVNVFVIESNASRGDHLIGVSWYPRYGKFMAQCQQLGGMQKTLGYFDTEIEAHQAWLTEKRRLSRILASQQEDHRVAKSLIDRYLNYRIIG